MELYHFGGEHFKVPELNSIDSLREAAEKRDAQVRANMSKPDYLAAIAVSLMEMVLDESTPLGELSSLLFECPIRDVFDLRAFEYMRDGQRIGKSVIHIVASMSLEAYSTESDRIGF